MKNSKFKNSILILVFAIVVLVFLFLKMAYVQPPGHLQEQEIYSVTKNDVIEVKVQFQEPTIVEVDEYHRVEMRGSPSIGHPGEPVLPVKGINVLIPAGKRIKDSEILLGERVTLSGKYNVEVGQRPLPLVLKKTLPKEEIYKSNNPFPSEKKKRVTIQMMRGYRIAVFNLYPVEYIPLDGKLSYYRTLTLKIALEPEEKIIGKPGEAPPEKPKIRKSPEDKKRVEDFVVNPQDISSYESLME